MLALLWVAIHASFKARRRLLKKRPVPDGKITGRLVMRYGETPPSKPPRGSTYTAEWFWPPLAPSQKTRRPNPGPHCERERPRCGTRSAYDWELVMLSSAGVGAAGIRLAILPSVSE